MLLVWEAGPPDLREGRLLGLGVPFQLDVWPGQHPPGTFMEEGGAELTTPITLQGRGWGQKRFLGNQGSPMLRAEPWKQAFTTGQEKVVSAPSPPCLGLSAVRSHGIGTRWAWGWAGCLPCLELFLLEGHGHTHTRARAHMHTEPRGGSGACLLLPFSSPAKSPFLPPSHASSPRAKRASAADRNHGEDGCGTAEPRQLRVEVGPIALHTQQTPSP